MSDITTRMIDYKGRLYLGNSEVRGNQVEQRDYLYGLTKYEKAFGGAIIGAGILTALFADQIIRQAF